MNIAILSRERRSYSTRRLREAALSRGHRARVLDTLRFSVLLEQGAPELFYGGKAVGSFDAVIPRVGTSVTYFGTTVVRQFDQLGAFCLNPALAINYSRDKLRSMQMLSRYDIGIPPTAFVRDRKDVLGAIERVGGAPVIIKLLEGTQGVGVILAETQKVAEAIIETLQSAKQNVLVQKFVAESKGRDIRAFVIGDRVAAAMRRRAIGTEFRSNIHRGGTSELVELDESYTRTAVAAAQVLGLRLAGVDILEGRDGPQVMEVNSSPGFQGIESLAGPVLAEQVIEYLEERVRFPDIDVRYRLGQASGFGAAEVPIMRGSVLIGKALSETTLRERGVMVLSVMRGRELLSSPTGETRIERGDVLLCYGPFGVIRDLLPARRRRARSKRSGQVGGGDEA